MTPQPRSLRRRFGQLQPIVIDLETSGLEDGRHGILELAAVAITLDDDGNCLPGEILHLHVEPFAEAEIDPEALAINGIRPNHPFRYAVDEQATVAKLEDWLGAQLHGSRCRRVVWTGHNIAFDLGFLNALYARQQTAPKRYHPFVSFDTATLSAVWLRETVLAKALYKANIAFDINEAHSALYDAQKTAELFCELVNRTHASP